MVSFGRIGERKIETGCWQWTCLAEFVISVFGGPYERAELVVCVLLSARGEWRWVVERRGGGGIVFLVINDCVKQYKLCSCYWRGTSKLRGNLRFSNCRLKNDFDGVTNDVHHERVLHCHNIPFFPKSTHSHILCCGAASLLILRIQKKEFWERKSKKIKWEKAFTRRKKTEKL